MITSQPYVFPDSTMGLSLYVYADVPDAEKIRMQITSPDGELSWNIIPNKESYSGLTYLGTSSITMPKGCDLPKGDWKLLFMYKDGRSVEQYFKVDYRDKDKLVEESSATDTVFYSSASNLTFIP